jgi:two-component system OmpR family sensor kinase/two-component system sensor histidine kinase BaeS
MIAFIAVTMVTVLVIALVSDSNFDRQFQGFLAQRAAGEAQPGQGPRGGAMAHMNMTPAELAFRLQLRETLVTAGLIAGGIGLLLSIVISRAIGAPLRRLARAAHDFAAHRWDKRVPLSGTEEIDEVAQAFNTMADEIQRAEMLRRNLMADIAHELRTPLTTMQGSLRALLDGVYPLELKEIASLYDDTRLLSRLVSDLRELALADAGQLPLKLETVDVMPYLRAAADQFTPLADSQQATIQFEEQPLPPIIADPDRLKQVVRNLVANALRHTPLGTITLSAAPQEGRVRIAVTDTGEGIPAEDLPHVFDRFYRADQSRARSTGGTGLGLAISKAWVEAMGGNMGAESTPGQGSTFWFTLRMAPSTEK